MKICYVISYRSPDYIRSKLMIKALKTIPGVEVFVAKNRSKGIKRYFETIKQFLKIWFKETPDLYFIGFRGHEVFPFIKIFALRKPFIFDQMVSPYDSFRNESKDGILGQLISFLIYPFEFIILHLSTIVLTDTQLHKDFMISKFKLSKKKVKSAYVGSEELVVKGKRKPINQDSNNLKVFFYGNFLPLHGIKYILEAAAQLKGYPIEFVLVGGKGRNISEYTAYINEKKLTNVTHYEWLEFDQLFEKAIEADLCLGGPFGGTKQARRIITGKTYQFLSLGIPTVVGKIEIDAGFIDRENCLLVNQEDSTSLTEAILWCLNNKDRLEEIGKNGHQLYLDNFGKEALANHMEDILKEYE